jgi:methylated-DNA-[protein]-cysteine S-methyltransferase
MSAILQTLETPDGPFTILEVDGRVAASGWTDDPAAILARLAPPRRPMTVATGEAAAADAVAAYYDGDVAALDDVPVLQEGTELQLSGWRALRTIAPGHPLTYTAFAALLGNPRAVRFAASVCARNAPALFVPCHRVLRTDGSLGGFAWGIGVKQSLLAREEAASEAGNVAALKTAS